MSQANLMSPFTTVGPVAAFLDYPTALAYAEAIFTSPFTFNGQTPRDLVFLLPITPSPTLPATPTPPAATLTT